MFYIIVYSYYRLICLQRYIKIRKYKNILGKNLVVSIIFCNFAAEISDFTVILEKI